MASEGFNVGSFGASSLQFPPKTSDVPPWGGPRHRNRLRSPPDPRIREPVPDVWDQEGYRWREDDGSETTATWVDAQDVDINRAIDDPVRLRILANVTGDPGAKQFQLEYRKTSDPNWVRVQ